VRRRRIGARSSGDDSGPTPLAYHSRRRHPRRSHRLPSPVAAWVKTSDDWQESHQCVPVLRGFFLAWNALPSSRVGSPAPKSRAPVGATEPRPVGLVAGFPHVEVARGQSHRLWIASSNRRGRLSEFDRLGIALPRPTPPQPRPTFPGRGCPSIHFSGSSGPIPKVEEGRPCKDGDALYKSGLKFSVR
jgi:hypothetical protein